MSFAGAARAPRNVRQADVDQECGSVHYAVIQQTSFTDATHECFYPAAGDHQRPGMSQQVEGRTYDHYWRITHSAGVRPDPPG